jgi:hypothetical protein
MEGNAMTTDLSSRAMSSSSDARLVDLGRKLDRLVAGMPIPEERAVGNGESWVAASAALN